jgi:type I restriction enzyme M protein
LKKSTSPIKLNYNKFLKPEEYLDFYLTDETKNKQDFENLLIFSDKLNNDLFKVYKIKEDERAILIAAILVALKNQSFNISYQTHILPSDLCEAITLAVKTELKKLKINQNYIDLVLGHFSFICQSPKFRSDIDLLKNLILSIDENINGYIKNTKYKDILGNLYVKFLEKANGDKQLGIVLTPEHIAGFMVRLLDLNPDSIVLDNCAGTGGFLLAASKFKAKLLGIEYEPKMFTLMILNLMVHDLSLEDIYQGDSLSNEFIDIVEKKQPNAGILNPPYDGREWEFIFKNMKKLKKNSKCVAIVPISTLTSNNSNFRKEILENHTVEAVFSMPEELFFNSKTSVVTCVILFTANTPHPSEKEVYFGYYKNDGFKKKKKIGRYDQNNTWTDIENEWYWDYINKKEKKEYSITKKITYNDEWCAEFFLETDYSKITEKEFENVLKKYAAFKILND